MTPLAKLATQTLWLAWCSCASGQPVERDRLDALVLEAGRIGLKWSPRAYRELSGAGR